jgi:hypothetical protein
MMDGLDLKVCQYECVDDIMENITVFVAHEEMIFT